MLLRLKLYRFLIKLAVYPLPLAAFYLGLALWAFSRSFLGRPADFSAYSRFTVPLLACFVWAFLAEHYKVTSVDELFRERTGTKAVVAACFATSTVLLAALYFSGNAEFPRGFFVFSVAVLLVLAVLLRAISARCAAATSTTPAPRGCWLSAQTHSRATPRPPCSGFRSLPAAWPRSCICRARKPS